jgi:hypothetical protein
MNMTQHSQIPRAFYNTVDYCCVGVQPFGDTASSSAPYVQQQHNMTEHGQHTLRAFYKAAGQQRGVVAAATAHSAPRPVYEANG